MDNRHVYCNISDDFSYLSHGCVLSRSQVQLFATHHVLQPARLLCLWDFPGKDTGVGCHFLLQEVFLTQGSKPGLLHYRGIIYHLSHRESPRDYLTILKL